MGTLGPTPGEEPSFGVTTTATWTSILTGASHSGSPELNVLLADQAAFE
jgi:hypothetical protein